MKQLGRNTLRGAALVLAFVLAACGGAPQPMDTWSGVDRPREQAVYVPLPSVVGTSADTMPACLIGNWEGDACVVTPAQRRAYLGPWGLWEAALASCPDDRLGSLADVWRWHDSPLEASMRAVAVDDEAVALSLLSSFEGTSIILRLRDATTRENLGVIKTTTSNTRVDAEVYAWRLSQFAGMRELVVPTIPVSLEAAALARVVGLLASQQYGQPDKDARRERTVAQMRAVLARNGGYPGAMKPWVQAFQFVGELGTRESLAGSALLRMLRSDGIDPMDVDYRLSQFTRLYAPAGTYEGTSPATVLATDLSNLLLLDALMGQVDRYAGANVHMVSVAGQRQEVGTRNGLPRFDLGEIRLLALDNGAALANNGQNALAWIQGRIDPNVRVDRYDRRVVSGLRALGRRWLGAGCDTAAYVDEADAIRAYLGVAGVEGDRAARNLAAVLAHLDAVERRLGDAMYLPSIELPTAFPRGMFHPPGADMAHASRD